MPLRHFEEIDLPYLQALLLQLRIDVPYLQAFAFAVEKRGNEMSKGYQVQWQVSLKIYSNFPNIMH